MRPRPLLPAALIVCLAIGCGGLVTSPAADGPALALEQPWPAPGQSALRIARVYHYGDPVLVDVPSAATAGTPFTVAVTTYGGGCVAEDTTVVQVDGAHADVVPYQRVFQPGPQGACTMELRITKRQASVTFAQAGTATVRVVGRAMPGDSLVVVQRTVTVR